MSRYVLAAALAAAVGLSPLAASAHTHHHKKHHAAMSNGTMKPGTTTGMGGGANGTPKTSNSPMPNEKAGGNGPSARGTNGE